MFTRSQQATAVGEGKRQLCRRETAGSDHLAMPFEQRRPAPAAVYRERSAGHQWGRLRKWVRRTVVNGRGTLHWRLCTHPLRPLTQPRLLPFKLGSLICAHKEIGEQRGVKQNQAVVAVGGEKERAVEAGEAAEAGEGFHGDGDAGFSAGPLRRVHRRRERREAAPPVPPELWLRAAR